MRHNDWSAYIRNEYKEYYGTDMLKWPKWADYFICDLAKFLTDEWSHKCRPHHLQKLCNIIVRERSKMEGWKRPYNHTTRPDDYGQAI